jgi:Holliday junction resolvase RusA-like endonuclease
MTNPLLAVDSIKIVAMCTPEPQGSMRAFMPKGWTRPILTSDNKDLKSYRQEVSKAAMVERQKNGFCEVMFGKHVPVMAEFKFFFSKPVSVGKKRNAHVVRPDVDKLMRATMDALKGIIYLDDSQVCDAHGTKEYGLPERVEVVISGKVTETPQSLFVTEDVF